MNSKISPFARMLSKVLDTISTQRRAYAEGNKALADGRLKVAEEKVSYAVSFPGTPTAWIERLGFIQERAGNYHEALKSYYDAISKDPTHAEWYYRAGVCAKALGDSPRATELFESAVRKKSGHPRAAKMLTSTIPKKTPSWRKLELLELALKNSDDVDVVRQTAHLNFHMRRYGRAVELLELMCAKEECSEADKVLLATSYLEQQQLELGYTLLRGLLSTTSQAKAKNVGPGYFLDQRHDWVNAAKVHACSWEMDDINNADTAFGAGYALDRQYRWEEAVPWYEKAIASDGGDRAYWAYKYAHALERLARYREASAWYKRALVLGNFKQADWFYRLGAAAYLDGQYEDSFLALRNWAAPPMNGPVKTADTSRDDFGTSNPECLARRYADRIGKEVNTLREKLLVETPGLERIAQRSVAAARLAVATGDLRSAWESYLLYVNHDPDGPMHLFVEAVDCAYKLGLHQTASRMLMDRREFFRPDGIDMSKSIKSDYDRRRLRFAEYCDRFAIDEKAVLLESYWGTQISDNPLAIYLKMIDDERCRDYRFYWVVQPNLSIPDDLRDDGNTVLISYGSRSYDKLLATAKIVVNNTSFVEYYERRVGQRYVNTWHGTPMKTLGKRIQTGVLEHANVARNFLNVTDFALPNAHTASSLVRDYDVEGIIATEPELTGSPRLDRLVNLDGARLRRVYDRLGISYADDRRIVLFAPTWRGSADDKSMNVEIAAEALSALCTIPNAVILFRAHHLAEEAAVSMKGNFRVVPRDIDTYDLLGCVDVLVSDYSSIIFDYMVTGRNIVSYVPDIDEYVEERGLYFFPNDVVDNVATTLDDLTALVDQSDFAPGTIYAASRERYCAQEDGKAAARVLDRILNEPRKKTPSTRTPLVFFESMIPNGIRSSFENLCQLIDHDRYELFVTMDVKQMVANADRQEGLKIVGPSVGVIGRIGEMLLTLEERFALAEFSKRFGDVSEGLVALVDSAYRREFRRLFGDPEGVLFIDFEGYSRFWNALLSRGVSKASRSGVLLHNQMDLEMDKRFPYLAEIVRNYQYYDAIASVSDAIGGGNAQAVADLGVELKSSPLVVHNSIDADGIRSRAESGTNLWKSRPPSSHRIVSIGRLSPEKNQNLLVEAMPLILNELPDAQLIVVGSGPSEPTLQAQVRDMRLTNHVWFAGFESNPMPTLSASNLFVMSSVHEGQPMVIFEAMTLTVPVLTTPVPGCVEACEHGDGHVADWDPGNFAQSVIALLQNKREARRYEPISYNTMALAEFDRFVARAVGSGLVARRHGRGCGDSDD